MSFTDFEMVVGLEIHVRLNTQSKAFCADFNQYGDDPNSNISPISLGQPGTLPMINLAQIEKGIKLGLALGCDINSELHFDRKHYFYPDLPKGYQLTQDKQPICNGGEITINSDGVTKVIRIHHIHMEEDAGKLIHDSEMDSSLVDHNRAGTPLLEIVTEPDLRSGQEVHDFMQKMMHLIEWLEISDANPEKGSFRCDCNVSIRRRGEVELGERCEIKNLNSKKFAKQAVEIEAKRQYEIISRGGHIENMTLNFDPASGTTTPIRSKETIHDYRYFPDPDLGPLSIKRAMITRIEAEVHPLPEELMDLLKTKYELSEYEAEILCRKKDIANYFLNLAKVTKNSKLSANLMINKVLPILEEEQAHISSFILDEDQLVDLIGAIDRNIISHTVAFQNVFPHLIVKPQSSVQQIIEELDLALIGDKDALSELIASIFVMNDNEVQKFRSGKKALFGFFMGEVMKKSKGKFDPKEIKSMLSEMLNN